MLKIENVTMDGLNGDFRSDDEQLGFKGFEGTVVACQMSAVRAAEWLEGSLRVAYVSEDGSQYILALDGFHVSQFEAIRRHFQDFAGIDVKDHGALRAQLVAPTLLEKPPQPPLPGKASQPSANPPPRRSEESSGSLSARGNFISRGPGGGARDDDSDDEYPVAAARSSRASGSSSAAPASGPAVSGPTGPSPDRSRTPTRDTGSMISTATCPALGPVVSGGAQGVLMEGYIMKRSRYLMQWRRRYLVIKQNQILSYQEKGESAPTAILEPVAVDLGMSRSKPDNSKGQFFTVTAAQGADVYHFRTENRELQQRWVEKIAECARRTL